MFLKEFLDFKKFEEILVHSSIIPKYNFIIVWPETFFTPFFARVRIRGRIIKKWKYRVKNLAHFNSDFIFSFFVCFCRFLILLPSSTENLCSRSRALIRAITPARVFPPFHHPALINTRRRGRGTADRRRGTTTAAGGVRWKPGTKTAKSYCRRDGRRMWSSRIRDFKTNISRVNSAWMYVSLLPGNPWLCLPKRGRRRRVAKTPRGKRAEQIVDVLLYIFPAELSQPRREGKKSQPSDNQGYEK